MKECIRVENLTYRYEEEESKNVTALDGVSFSVESGSFTVIAGPNGSGKSTLAKCLNALLLPTEGRVCVYGFDTADEDHLWDIRSRCGMVFQNPDNQLVSSIVEDDVAFGPENLGIDPAEIRERVDEALTVCGMYEFRNKGPHLLSGGQKQRVAIAGVLAMNPNCIVFDEPTAMLDPSGRKEVMDIIAKLHEVGRTVILITHFMEEAEKADRIIVMDRGRIALDGTPKEIFAQTEKLEQYHLEPPFAACLAAKLRERGIDVPEGITSEKELEAFLCR